MSLNVLTPSIHASEPFARARFMRSGLTIWHAINERHCELTTLQNEGVTLPTTPKRRDNLLSHQCTLHYEITNLTELLGRFSEHRITSKGINHE